MTTHADPRVQDMLDRQEIHQRLVNISRGADRLDRDLFLSSFHADCQVDLASFAGGPAELYDWARRLSENTVQEHHYLLNHDCEIAGDTAHAETYFLYVAQPREGAMWQAGGRYLDRFDRRDGAWRIAFRYNLIEWSGRLAEAGLPFDISDVRPNGRPSRDPTDPSYRRPLVNLRPA
jgi:hypothetical protein